MSDLTKNRTANALVWAAFFAFWLHSLHCCRTHCADEGDRCVFDLRSFDDNFDATRGVCDAFHRSPQNSTSTARRSRPFDAAPSFASSLVRSRGAQTPCCVDVCPSSRLKTEKKVFVDSDAFSPRTFADLSANDARFLAAVAFSNRFVNAFSTPLYLRLRQFLN